LELALDFTIPTWDLTLDQVRPYTFKLDFKKMIKIKVFSLAIPDTINIRHEFFGDTETLDLMLEIATQRIRKLFYLERQQECVGLWTRYKNEVYEMKNRLRLRL